MIRGEGRKSNLESREIHRNVWLEWFREPADKNPGQASNPETRPGVQLSDYNNEKRFQVSGRRSTAPSSALVTREA